MRRIKKLNIYFVNCSILIGVFFCKDTSYNEGYLNNVLDGFKDPTNIMSNAVRNLCY